MKKAFIFAGLLMAMAMTVPAFAVPPQEIQVQWYQAQLQWRAFGGVFGDWTYTYFDYLVPEEENVFILTGKILHQTFTWEPIVDWEHGTSTEYIFNRPTENWVQREGLLQYAISGYGYDGFTLTNFWKGFLYFGGETPSTETFVLGMNTQWVYIFRPESDASVTDAIPNAYWDDVVKAWLVGYSIYVYHHNPQGSLPPFDCVLVEPIPLSSLSQQY